MASEKNYSDELLGSFVWDSVSRKRWTKSHVYSPVLRKGSSKCTLTPLTSPFHSYHSKLSVKMTAGEDGGYHDV